jgi:hypothetical protein
MRERKTLLIRLDPVVHDALAQWAGDELRSTNAQIEFLLRDALTHAGRLPRNAGSLPKRDRPAKSDTAPGAGAPDYREESLTGTS